ncbi:3-phosphoshikimate 1-carboxyvinyltransferase [Sporomusa acidovorans]|uniref:3-phosphoshikimate 1-carboxyvinyltransferase n=1 Tax=Sporomusa acidovorans (strain ATCC 49682 / DSM 3132 / Mol) TaxID=1123286 RepID=A0ABZ3J358_SPOA4|nr:3-phosphoshikimate 1-carboxyvinyltransferase [Sporomusa acidovorans]OZC20312.1 3-phosphoshikimate 1-carboxyvinyltransferase 1 [Sporomusa acidovorans DSM 3132]SDD38246.1 3-phosphoshikimate 1-carboxyvinyltransferase [Sporomusa acidovorans]
MGQNIQIQPTGNLTGSVNIPGDKSISHRSIMLAGLANTPVKVTNFLHAADCWSTINCMRALGVSVDQDKEGALTVTGNGFYGLREPKNILDAGNSGTTIRLLTGLLGAQPFFSIITGDASLRKRPMARVITPLIQMGLHIVGREQSRYAPLAIHAAEQIRGIEYDMPVASAQVKSAILLAALYASSPTVLHETMPSRDHTERMFETFGIPVKRVGNSIILEPVKQLQAPEHINVPGDISSAAFWLIAASIIPNSQLVLHNVGINPTRTGILDILQQMGADITVTNERWSGREPVADLVVRSAKLKGVTVEAEIIPRLIDEIPILAVAASFAQGQTIIKGAEELRVKETDRLKAISLELGKMGARITETADGLIIDGSQSLHAALCHSHDDHRMAMALAIAGLAARGVEIEEADCVKISYPDFFAVLADLSSGLTGGKQ